MNQRSGAKVVRKFLVLLAAVLVMVSTSRAVAQADHESSARLNRHAVIIGIGKYNDPRIPTLRGVVHDIDNARRMAESMGVPSSNITVLQDDAATYTNIRQTLRDLGRRVRDGDRIFIYYSGHGTRITVPESPSVCREALIPVNTQMSTKSPLLSQEDIAEDLSAVYVKADKVFVFFDACHSGGLKTFVTAASTTRVNGEDLTPKFAALDSAAQCSVPSNVRRRSVVDAARSRGALPNNVVQLSSSRPDEISLDSPTTGGLATDAWRYCSIYADDADGSGSLSVAEIGTCVQQRINDRLKNQAGYTGQNIVISGNTAFTPTQERPDAAERSRGKTTPIAANAAVSANPVPLTETRQRPAGAALATPAINRFPLESLVAQSDARHHVSVQHTQTPLKIGRDSFDISVQSDRGGYVYLVLQSSDNESTYVVFPNGLDQDNRIKPNQWMQLPRPAWRLVSQGPVGKNRLLVMVTDAPRSISELKTKPDGPFVKTLNDRPAAQALSWLAGRSSSYSVSACGAASSLARKDLEYVETCSDSFGATMVEFIETN